MEIFQVVFSISTSIMMSYIHYSDSFEVSTYHSLKKTNYIDKFLCILSTQCESERINNMQKETLKLKEVIRFNKSNCHSNIQYKVQM